MAANHRLEKIGVEVDGVYPITIEVFQGLMLSFSELGIEKFRTVVEASHTTKDGDA